MSKKIIIPISIIVILALAAGAFGLVGTANAAQPVEVAAAAIATPRSGFGQVTAVGQNQFTVKNQTVEKILQVTSQTRFFNWDGTPRQFSDVQVGGWVIVRASRTANGTINALQVVMLPQGFDGGRIDQRAAGRITAVDTAAGSFTLKNGKGQELTYTVNTSTVFLGKVNDLAALKVGMGIIVGGVKQADNSLLAALVAARQPLARGIGRWSAGKVTQVSSNSFSIMSLMGKEMTFQVMDATRFFSQGQKVKSLVDLKDGMIVMVHYQVEAGGSLLARQVVAGAQ